MAEFVRGEEVGIPCDVRPGPFSGERLVSVDTVQGPVSGFVRDSEFFEKGGITYLRGIVNDVRPDALEVWIRGSFFTTTGLTYFSREWAGAHVQSLRAA